jgi:hypothetical protein
MLSLAVNTKMIFYYYLLYHITAGNAVLAGSHHLTLPFDVLQAIAVHELSQQTVDEFAKNGRGISY